jgi:hypothetical protein
MPKKGPEAGEFFNHLQGWLSCARWTMVFLGHHWCISANNFPGKQRLEVIELN